MRVKISYTMDINDVPDKAAEIIHQSLNELQEARDLLNRTLSDMDRVSDNISHALVSLDRARLAMGSADSSLAEVHSIMAALEIYYNGEENVSDGRSTMDSGRSHATQTTNPGEG
jgi:hypothetical protein